MRTILIALALCVACDDAPETADPNETTSNVETTAETAAPEPVVPEPTAVETTPGFIEAKVDGELKRYEHLRAAENLAAANGTFVKAHASEESDEGFDLSLVHIDVRTLDFPTVIRQEVSAMRMAMMAYEDAEGTRSTMAFNDDSFQCQSFEDLLLKCTFSGTAHGDDGPLEITDGRLEVQLTTNAAADAFVRGTSNPAVEATKRRIREVAGEQGN